MSDWKPVDTRKLQGLLDEMNQALIASAQAQIAAIKAAAKAIEAAAPLLESQAEKETNE